MIQSSVYISTAALTWASSFLRKIKPGKQRQGLVPVLPVSCEVGHALPPVSGIGRQRLREGGHTEEAGSEFRAVGSLMGKEV